MIIFIVYGGSLLFLFSYIRIIIYFLLKMVLSETMMWCPIATINTWSICFNFSLYSQHFILHCYSMLSGREHAQLMSNKPLNKWIWMSFGVHNIMGDVLIFLQVSHNNVPWLLNTFFIEYKNAMTGVCDQPESIKPRNPKYFHVTYAY